MRIIALALLIGGCFTSCTKQEIGQHRLEYLMDFVIGAGQNPLQTHVYEKAIRSGWEEFLSAHQLHDSLIEKVLIYSIGIRPLLANPISYGFVEEARAFIADKSLPSTQQIGIANPVPGEPEGELFLLPGIANVKSFLNKEIFHLILHLRYRNVIRSTTDHLVTFRFEVFVK
ncbi:MAG: hypothetical protein IPM48_06760 [Saprospiraceae bacterium]|nr:hypothetical protein [Saprospiraceae bacterium]